NPDEHRTGASPPPSCRSRAAHGLVLHRSRFRTLPTAADHEHPPPAEARTVPRYPVSTPDTETPETRRLPKEIYVLVAAAFIVALGYGIIAPVLPQFAASFDFGVTAATIVVS